MFITFFFLFYLCECNKFPEIVMAFAYHSGDLEKKKENDRSRFSRKNLVCLKMVKKGQKWAQNWVFLAFITRNLQWKTLQFSVFICKSHVWKNSGTIGKYSGKELSLPPPPEGWGRGGGRGRNKLKIKKEGRNNLWPKKYFKWHKIRIKHIAIAKCDLFFHYRDAKEISFNYFCDKKLFARHECVVFFFFYPKIIYLSLSC